MHYGNIKIHDIADGPGVRVSLFVSGCTHHCDGCFNPETWDFEYGQEFTEQTEQQIIRCLKPDYIKGLTILGGEPFEPVNQRGIVKTIRRIRQKMPDKDIWVYTGYTLERDIIPEEGAAHCEVTDELLSYIDVLVDGEFVLEQKSLLLPFRGSQNQRLIDVQKTLKSGNVTEYILQNPR